MVVRRGHVIAEGWWAPYAPEHNHILYSLSKSFTSTAVGLAIAEGKLDLFDPVLKFFPEDAPAEPGPNLRAMRVRDLLTMSTGHQDEPPAAPDVVSAQTFLAQEVPHKPGTHFKYNTAATFMLSAIVQKQTGQTLLDYLRPRLFEPLGIENPVWDTNFQGISLGGYGLRVRTEGIAKFGQLYLQKGMWNGKQVLPASWVELATSRQVSNGSNPDSDWDQGYGFQFWRSRHNAWRGDGAFGQYCVVMPDQDTVVAITSGVRDMQAVLNVIWDRLLPALHEKALPTNTAGSDRLKQRLAKLQLPTAQGRKDAPGSTRVMGRTFVFPANDRKLEAITLQPAAGTTTIRLVLQIDGAEHEFPCGHQTWQTGRGRFGAFPDEPVAGSHAWDSNDVCVVRLCAYETPFVATLRLAFDENQLTLDSEQNVAFGPTKHPQLTGTVE
jgi:CubicO group peptidase (beta-lactamase class C family)